MVESHVLHVHTRCSKIVNTVRQCHSTGVVHTTTAARQRNHICSPKAECYLPIPAFKLASVVFAGSFEAGSLIPASFASSAASPFAIVSAFGFLGRPAETAATAFASVDVDACGVTVPLVLCSPSASDALADSALSASIACSLASKADILESRLQCVLQYSWRSIQ